MFDQRMNAVAVRIDLKMHEDLVALVDADAGPRPRNEIIARILAHHYGKPELSEIPRKAMGRPRGTKRKGRR